MVEWYLNLLKIWHTVIEIFISAYKKVKKLLHGYRWKRITHVIVHHMITYASLRTKMSYKYRQMSKLCIYWRKENFRQQGVVFVGGDSVSSQSKSHCFPDHKIELFLWCHRHRHASMSYVLVRRFIVRELHLIARKLLFSILTTYWHHI